MCERCHKVARKLSSCARCHHAWYCGVACQRAAWQLDKPCCRAIVEQLTSHSRPIPGTFDPLVYFRFVMRVRPRTFCLEPSSYTRAP